MSNKIRLIFHLVYLIFFFTCSTGPKKEHLPYRFIDQLDSKNIISSPFTGLYQKFNKIEQKWSGKELKSFVINQQKYYAISSRLPVLGWENQGKPQMMKILLEGKEIPFQKDADLDTFSWTIKKGELEIKKFKKNTRETKVLLLNEKECLEEQFILPDGEFVLEVYAESKNPLAYLAKLKINLNNKSIGELIIGPKKCYKVIGQAKLGWNKFEFLYEKSVTNKEQPVKKLRISKISIKSLKDIFLFTTDEKKSDFMTSEFSAEYLAEPVDKIYRIEKNIEPFQRYIQEIEFDASDKRNIEIIGHSSWINSVMEVKLNDQKIYEGKVTDPCQNIFSIERKREKGKYDLELEYIPPDREKGYFYLSWIIIKNPTGEIDLHLAKIKEVSLIHDLASGKNPSGLKKKLVVPESPSKRSIQNAINTILAPPLTYLEFELKIPQSATLEFGYGLSEKSWEEKSSGVFFKIIIDEKKKEKIIFSQHINPYQKKSHRKLFQEKIDLSSYSDKKARLKFITASYSFGKEASTVRSHMGKEFAYWYNPVIYSSSEKEKKVKPEINIILISLDTLRADHLKCYGYERETSPNMDQLGTEGVVFTNAFSSTSWTLPAHVSLLTSLDNRHHQVNTRNAYMDNSIITLADILRKNGYFNYGFTGSGLVSQQFGFSKGFDFYCDFRGSQRQRNSVEVLYKYFDNWLDKNKDKKFFLFLHTYQTHEPYFSPSPYNSLFLNKKKAKWEEAHMLRIIYDPEYSHPRRFKDLTPLEKENIVALYDGEIRYTDECLIKPLIEKLKELNLYQRTMIIVTSDHGEEFYDRKGWLHGSSLYNELVMIPLIIKFPYSKFKNTKISKCVRITDIMPTILQEADIDYSSFEFDGKSLVKIINNDDNEESIFVADLGSEDYPYKLPSKIAINFNELKLILNNDFGQPQALFGPYTPPTSKVELYDLSKDPLEKNNVAHQEEEIVRLLLKKIYELHPIVSEKREKKKKEIDEELEKTLRALGYIK